MRTVGSAVAAAGAVRPRGGCRQLRLDARRGSPGGLRRQQSAQLWARPARPSVRAQRRRFSPHRHEPQTYRGCLGQPTCVGEPGWRPPSARATDVPRLSRPSATQTVGTAGRRPCRRAGAGAGWPVRDANRRHGCERDRRDPARPAGLSVAADPIPGPRRAAQRDAIR